VHWIVTLNFLTLLVTGYVILMAHPRLYWGETGNELTPALFELPISRNHQHGGWEKSTPFFSGADSPVSAVRTFKIFNQNSWGRSLHFLAAWGLVLTGAVYFVGGIFSGHFRKHLVPRRRELVLPRIWAEVKDHLRLQIRAATGGPQYGLLQKCAYFAVVFLALPGTLLTGLTMSPAITAAHPWLLDVCGGYQSARTIHFFLAVALVLFVAVHVVMVAKSGFKRQLRAMTVGEKP
jgi:thiosulfate reductase cytochrome b subunit